MIDQEWVRLNLARVRAKSRSLKLLNWRQAWCMTQGTLNFADASTVKVFGTEFYVEAYRDSARGPRPGAATSRRGSAGGAAARAALEFIYRAALILTFGGGTNEIQRDIIAMAGLQMPRSLRG